MSGGSQIFLWQFIKNISIHLKANVLVLLGKEVQLDLGMHEKSRVTARK